MKSTTTVKPATSLSVEDRLAEVEKRVDEKFAIIDERIEELHTRAFEITKGLLGCEEQLTTILEEQLSAIAVDLDEEDDDIPAVFCLDCGGRPEAHRNTLRWLNGQVTIHDLNDLLFGVGRPVHGLADMVAHHWNSFDDPVASHEVAQMLDEGWRKKKEAECSKKSARADAGKGVIPAPRL